MAALGRYEILLGRFLNEVPKFSVTEQGTTLFSKILSWVVVTLFRAKGFTQTIGTTMYVPKGFEDWSDRSRYYLLRHEIVHVRQWRKWPIRFFDKRGLRWVNYLLFAACYLTVFPVRRTFRAKFEREAYTQSMLARYELGEFKSQRYRTFYIEHLVGNFSGLQYLFMWNTSDARLWAIETLHAIENGEITNFQDAVY